MMTLGWVGQLILLRGWLRLSGPDRYCTLIGCWAERAGLRTEWELHPDWLLLWLLVLGADWLAGLAAHGGLAAYGFWFLVG